MININFGVGNGYVCFAEIAPSGNTFSVFGIPKLQLLLIAKKLKSILYGGKYDCRKER